VVCVRSKYVLGFNAVWSVESEQALLCLSFASSVVSCLAYSSTLNPEAICASESCFSADYTVLFPNI
jgi:hypothetical protein